MISHDRAQELISARMDVPLTSAEHLELQGHLATCAACRAFVTHADDIARNLQVMPRLAASPMVSRAVMTAISTDHANSGWGWLRHGLQALSSPGMAVASSMALVLALAGALLVALNAPTGNNPGTGVTPEGTIAALAPQPLPTEAPTEAPAPTRAADGANDEVAEPTATRVEGRSIEPKPTEAPKTPTPRPTATSVPIIDTTGPVDRPAIDSPPIQPAGDAITEEPVQEPALAMAGDEAPAADPSAEMAQAAEPVAPADTQEIVEEPVAAEGESAESAPAASEDEVAPETASAPEDDQSSGRDNRRKDEGGKVASDEAPVEPLPTRQVGPLPVEAIAALEGVGTAPDIVLPPAPLDPMQPDQSFLPVTPTPVTDGTPTPESEQASESEAPQLAEDWTGDLGVTALAPEEPADEAPVVADAPDESTSDSRKEKDKGKRDRDSSSGKSHEQQQSAYVESPMAWSTEPLDLQNGAGQPVELQQTADQPVAPEQTTQYPVDASSTSGETAGTTAAAEPPAPEPQIDPATGMQIDPATGYLIDPTTGYLLDRVNGRVIDPRTSYEVHPGTGLLIDPATGAMLDPNTLEVVIPAGFGDDQPAYDPGSPEMRGSIETVVDDTYNSASIRMEPATDGPVQPIGEIVVPTESGDAVEIS